MKTIQDLKPHHYEPGKRIIKYLIPKIRTQSTPLVIGIGGEHGSGKSVQALAFKTLLHIEGFETLIVRMKDYFLLPPKANNERRLKDFDTVGPSEINLTLIQNHVNFIKGRESDMLIKPLVSEEHNAIRKEFVEIQDVNCIIVEGIYALLLENLDVGIFIARTYLETRKKRLELGIESEPNDGRFLLIEHEIIRKHHRVANYIIDKEYKVSKSTPTTEPGPHLRV